MTSRFRILAVAVALVSTAVVARAQNAAIGEWDLTTQSPEGTSTNMVVIKEDGGKLMAMAKSAQGERPYDSVEVKGSSITLVLTITYSGSPMVITYVGDIGKDGMSGAADFGGLATGTWSAVAHK